MKIYFFYNYERKLKWKYTESRLPKFIYKQVEKQTNEQTNDIIKE